MALLGMSIDRRNDVITLELYLFHCDLSEDISFVPLAEHSLAG
jgi:hypothetical protein